VSVQGLNRPKGQVIRPLKRLGVKIEGPKTTKAVDELLYGKNGLNLFKSVAKVAVVDSLEAEPPGIRK